MLPLQTIHKMFRDHFPGEAVGDRGILTVKKADRQQQLLDILARFEGDETIDGKVWDYVRGENKDWVLGLVLYGPKTGRNAFDYFKIFYIEYGKKHGLWIMDAKKRRRTTQPIDPVAIASLEQLDSFVSAVKERQNRDHLREKRKDKIAQLKQVGLAGRLEELGAENNFSFAIGQTTREVNLSIRVKGRKRGFHFSFPKSKLDAVLEQVPDLVETLERLQSLGVHFRADNKKWAHRQGEWVEPAADSNSDSKR